MATSKFYFFDVGVANYLIRRGTVLPGSPEFGRALEHLLFLEIRTYLDYGRMDIPLTFWRSQSRMEVDFLLGDRVTIEVKAKERITEDDLRGLRALSEERRPQKKIVVSLEKMTRITEDGIEVLPVPVFLDLLWQGGLDDTLK